MSYPRLLELDNDNNFAFKSDTPLHPCPDLGIYAVTDEGNIYLTPDITEVTGPDGSVYIDSDGRVSFPEVGHISWDTSDGRRVIVFNSSGKPTP